MTSEAFDYDSSARPPRALEELVELSRSGSLVRALVARNVKVRYKRSVFGVLWTAANPLLMLLVLTVAFSTVFRSVAPAYPVFLFPALLIWNFFAQTTMVITVETSGAAALWKRVPIPKTATPLATALTGVVNLALVVAPFVVILALVHRPLGPALLWVVPIAVLAGAFAFGVALVLSSIALFFPDFVHLYEVLLSAWFFVTPVIYPLQSIPARVRWLLRINPMTHFVEAFRDPLYRNASPSMGELGLLTLFAALALAIGWTVYTRTADEIPYRT